MSRLGKPRFTHPACSTSLSLANLSALAEVLFWRMIPSADDQGRLPGDTRVLKATCCPMRIDIDQENIDSLLGELEREGMISRYSNAVSQVIQVFNWWTYQTQQWAYPSKYPPPEGWIDHLRYKKGGKVLTQNWPVTDEPGKSTESSSLEAPAGPPSETVVEPPGEVVAKYLSALTEAYTQTYGPADAKIDSDLKLRAAEMAKAKAPMEWIDKIFGDALEYKRKYIFVSATLSRWSHDFETKGGPPGETVKEYLSALTEFYTKEIGATSESIDSELKDFASVLAQAKAPLRWIKEAFAEAAKHNKRSWAYTNAILERWMGESKVKRGRR